ncbi:hypothetical protein VN24_10885 [Paenibacillus beijingensis]|uniref:Uncharacterized protein n=1 Tax=Paenibacillus beijingensis TaxID=1126833 RepID=A0A0D5NIP6_9BACL|nr:hypothetical protein VN24_10885 [Paenibacillus beijingensis]
MRRQARPQPGKAPDGEKKEEKEPRRLHSVKSNGSGLRENALSKGSSSDCLLEKGSSKALRWLR